MVVLNYDQYKKMLDQSGLKEGQISSRTLQETLTHGPLKIDTVKNDKDNIPDVGQDESDTDAMSDKDEGASSGDLYEDSKTHTKDSISSSWYNSWQSF